MSTHGTMYRDWQQMDGAAQRLLGELAREQIVHVDLADYQPGQPHYERLLEAVAFHRRFTWPEQIIFNI
jgi:hypothetical protein